MSGPPSASRGNTGRRFSRADNQDAGKILSEQIIRIMRRLRVPNGLRAIGYTLSDVPALVQGTLPQHRVTKLSPRPAGEQELTELFEQAMQSW